jgi:uncharacterized membrane protein
MRQRLTLAERRLAEEATARKDLEFNQEARMQEMKRAIEMKQRELENMHNKMSLPVDTDILRMKVAKDMESRHRVEIEAKQQEVDRLAEQYYEARRHNEVLKAQIESVKAESEKEIKDLKEKHR